MYSHCRAATASFAFAFSSLVNIFIAVSEFAALRDGISESEYALLTNALYVLHLVSIVLFGLGFVLLIRHFHSAGLRFQSSKSTVDDTPTI